MKSRPRIIPLLTACIVAALLITACSGTPNAIAPTPAPVAQDPKPGTAEAAAVGERYMRSMSDTLAKSNSFTFETSERFDVGATHGQKKLLQFTRKVTVRRPNRLFFEIHGQGDSTINTTAHYDGKTLTLIEKPDGKWAQTAVPGTLDEMLDDVALRFGLPVPIGDVIYSSPYDAFIGSSTKGGLVGRETIEGVECVKLDYADDFVQVTVWVPATGQPLPRRLALGYKKSPTPLTVELTFTSWKLDAPVTEATFLVQRPTGHAPIDFGDFAAGLRSRLMPSPQQAGSHTGTGTKSSSKLAAR